MAIVVCNNGCGEPSRVSKLVKGIGDWFKKDSEPTPYPWQSHGAYGLFRERINYGAIRRSRTNRVRLSHSTLNSSQKNRQIRSIKTANHIAKGIHYKDCPDVS